MTLKEAFEKAKDGDMLSLKGRRIEFIKNFFAEHNYSMKIENMLSDDWEVIPAKKEPITANEWVHSYAKLTPWEEQTEYEQHSVYENMQIAFNAGEENERLRHG